MVCTSSMLDADGSSTTSITFQFAGRPFGLLSGVAVVIHMLESSSMNPVRHAPATRNPSRAPRFVPSSR
jgi:hypothetical protein